MIKVLANALPRESSLPGLGMATFALCPHLAFPLHTQRGRGDRWCLLLFS